MLETVVIIIFLLLVIGVLGFNILYKNRCIEDLEVCKRNIMYKKNMEFLRDLKNLTELQSFEPAGRETCTRNYLEYCISKYSKNESNTNFRR